MKNFYIIFFILVALINGAAALALIFKGMRDVAMERGDKDEDLDDQEN
jgi:hypothetical protein